MTFDLSWTDRCFLGLILGGLLFFIQSLRKKRIRQATVAIFQKPVAMIAAIMLLFFFTIAILDSIHFKDEQSLASYSCLDHLLAPLGQSMETSYSAPLALKAFISTPTWVEGKMHQQYATLEYPQDFITNEQQKWQWIKTTLGQALFKSLLLALLVGLACVRWLSIKANSIVTVTLFCCLMLVISSFELSRHLHVLGTGKIGEDIFYYTLKSIRTGLVIGTLTTLFMMPLALLGGIAAGYFGGWIDDVIQYIYTTLSSIPGVLLITASVLSVQTYIANHPKQFTTLAQHADARLLALCFILGMTSWTSLCRLLRAEALKLREIDFVLAAKALGSHWLKIIVKHLLPNVMHIVVITLVLDFSFLILAEAVLSYVGVGVSPMTISWGNMINQARLELARDPVVWWPVLAAFSLMFTLVLASNLFADAVRDAFDPHQANMV